jgi:hypothetical protein
MFVEGEPVQAFCHLGREGDSANQAFLTDASVIIRRSGRTHKYERSIIKSITFLHRFFLIPVIAGGIITSLGTVALLNNLGLPSLLLIVITSGIFLLYYGFQGGNALTVATAVKEYDIFLPVVTPQVRSFVRYIQWQLMTKDSDLYAAFTQEEWFMVKSSGQIPAGTPVYLHSQEIKRDSQQVAVAIKPHLQEINLQFQREIEDTEDRITLRNAVPIEIVKEI